LAQIKENPKNKLFNRWKKGEVRFNFLSKRNKKSGKGGKKTEEGKGKEEGKPFESAAGPEKKKKSRDPKLPREKRARVEKFTGYKKMKERIRKGKKKVLTKRPRENPGKGETCPRESRGASVFKARKKRRNKRGGKKAKMARGFFRGLSCKKKKAIVNPQVGMSVFQRGISLSVGGGSKTEKPARERFNPC